MASPHASRRERYDVRRRRVPRVPLHRGNLCEPRAPTIDQPGTGRPSTAACTLHRSASRP
jgi:hypothetical protein